MGLLFAAKACFDVREAPAFWGRTQLAGNLTDEVNIQLLKTAFTHLLKTKGDLKEIEISNEVEELIAFVSTHPAYPTRQANLIRIAKFTKHNLGSTGRPT